MAERGSRKIREGTVVSDLMDKTVVVQVRRLVRHPRYKRVIRRTSRCKAHDAQNECGVGDRVRIAETRPLSKTKRWRVLTVLEKAK
ncbi:MAG: 30S ribosomal protein S17 [Armatimonadetes bacterium]|nr:30S ribosomal protein S17 [Armatimonadota bacterium]